jgi:hypothetical protein
VISSTIQNTIVQILRNDEMSISRIKKELEIRKQNMHRLTLSGYLTAMVDEDILKVKEIKPSKVYSINQKGTVSMYKKIGKVVREIHRENQGDQCLGLLYHLFKRPIFIRELELCEVDLPRNYRRSISPKKGQFIRSFQEMGIEIPETDMIIEPENVNSVQLLKELRVLLLDEIKNIHENPVVDDDQTTLEDI